MMPVQPTQSANTSVEIPTLHSLGIPSPVYIRKLRKMSDWNGPIVSLFDINTPEHSVYYVSSDMDLYLSVAALNAKRLSEDEQLDLVYILPDEFNLASIKPFQTDDAEAIYCYQARKLHHGIITDNHNEKDKIHGLVKKLKDADRKAIRIRSKQALRIIEHLRPSGCHSYKLNRISSKISRRLASEPQLTGEVSVACDGDDIATQSAGLAPAHPRCWLNDGCALETLVRLEFWGRDREF